MFLKQQKTGAVEFVPWVCAAAAARSVFDDGLFWNIFPPAAISLHVPCRGHSEPMTPKPHPRYTHLVRMHRGVGIALTLDSESAAQRAMHTGGNV